MCVEGGTIDKALFNLPNRCICAWGDRKEYAARLGPAQTNRLRQVRLNRLPLVYKKKRLTAEEQINRPVSFTILCPFCRSKYKEFSDFIFFP